MAGDMSISCLFGWCRRDTPAFPMTTDKPEQVIWSENHHKKFAVFKRYHHGIDNIHNLNAYLFY